MLGYRVRRQQPFEGFFLDFYIRDLKVAIEVDGRLHDEQYEYDQWRDNILRKKGLTVIRTDAASIFQDVQSVVDYLRIRLNEIASTN